MILCGGGALQHNATQTPNRARCRDAGYVAGADRYGKFKRVAKLERSTLRML